MGLRCEPTSARSQRVEEEKAAVLIGRPALDAVWDQICPHNLLHHDADAGAAVQLHLLQDDVLSVLVVPLLDCSAVVTVGLREHQLSFQVALYLSVNEVVSSPIDGEDQVSLLRVHLCGTQRFSMRSQHLKGRAGSHEIQVMLTSLSAGYVEFHLSI